MWFGSSRLKGPSDTRGCSRTRQVVQGPAALRIGSALVLLCMAILSCYEPTDPMLPAERQIRAIPVGRMAIISHLTGRGEVYVLGEDEELRQITNVAAIRKGTEFACVFEVALSPDGKWVAYSLRNPQYEGWGIYVASADGRGEQRRLTAGGFDRDPCWSPDSKMVAFERLDNQNESRADRIWVVNREEPDSEKLLAKLDREPFSVVRLAWSPNGGTIILERFDKPGEIGMLTHSLWSVDVGSGTVARIPIDAHSVGGPAWFPDGSHIVYCAVKTSHEQWKLYVSRPDGSEERLLLARAYSIEDPTVSPDGRYIAFTHEFGRAYSGKYRIGIYDIETELVREITSASNVSWESPSWGRSAAARHESEKRRSDQGD